jgi:MFS family permease
MLRSRRPSTETWSLYVLFGAIYFVQGVGEPTEGLIAQPVRSILRGWGHGPAEIGMFAALLAIPWTLKPLFGLISDFVPIFGSRRRSYLILASLAVIVGLVGAGCLPLAKGQYRPLLGWLILPTLGVAFSDVAADALMVEAGQPRGLTGRLQAVQWASMYAATIFAGLVGGYLTEQKLERLGFAVCASLSVVTLALAIFAIRERDISSNAPQPRLTARALLGTLRSPRFAAMAAFLFLWNLNPFSTTVLQLFMTGPLGLSDQFYGNSVAVLAVGSLAACLAYTGYCRRVPMRLLVHVSIVLGLVSTLLYWTMYDRRSALGVALLVGFSYMTATLIQLDLAARACPPVAAATVFASLMALENLALSLSTWLGASWYERGIGRFGPTGSFRLLVGIGAAFTASCWLITPFLTTEFEESGARSSTE